MNYLLRRIALLIVVSSVTMFVKPGLMVRDAETSDVDAAISADASDLTFYEQEAVYQTNLKRQQHGLPPLRANYRITLAARSFAKEATLERLCGHQSRDGSWPGDRDGIQGRVGRFGYRGVYGAENVMCGFTDPLTAINAFYNEVPPNDGHRLNLLDPRSREVGVGYFYEEPDRGRAVQDFGIDASYPPAVINLDEPWTSDRDVEIYLYQAALDVETASLIDTRKQWLLDLRESSEYQISERFDQWPSSWQPFKSPIRWTLSEGVGLKRVYVRLRDRMLHSIIVDDDIYYGSDRPIGALRAELRASSTERVEIPVRPLPESRVLMGPWRVVNGDRLGYVRSSMDRVADPRSSSGIALRIRSRQHDCPSILECPDNLVARMNIDDLSTTFPSYVVLRLAIERGSTRAPLVRIMQKADNLNASTNVAITLSFSDTTSIGDYFEYALQIPSNASAISWRICALNGTSVLIDSLALFYDVTSDIKSSTLVMQHPNDNYRGQGVGLRYVNQSGTISHSDECYGSQKDQERPGFCMDLGADASPSTPMSQSPTRTTLPTITPAPTGTPSSVATVSSESAKTAIFLPLVQRKLPARSYYLSSEWQRDHDLDGQPYQIDVDPSGDVWVATRQGMYRHSDSVWSVTDPSTINCDAAVAGISLGAADNGWAVGDRIGPNGLRVPAIWHWDGDRWTIDDASIAALASAESYYLDGVTTTASGNAMVNSWVCWVQRDDSACFLEPYLLEHTLSGWTPPEGTGGLEIGDVAVVSGENLVGVGPGGIYERRQGTWRLAHGSLRDGDVRIGFVDVWAADSGTAWILSVTGYLFRWRQDVLTRYPRPLDMEHRGMKICGGGDEDLWAIDERRIWNWNGVAWTDESPSLPANETWVDCMVKSEADGWILARNNDDPDMSHLWRLRPRGFETAAVTSSGGE